MKEEKRYQKLLQDTKTTHDKQIAELKISQSKEIEKTEREHQEYLENAKETYEREQIKYQV